MEHDQTQLCQNYQSKALINTHINADTRSNIYVFKLLSLRAKYYMAIYAMPPGQ